MSMLKLAIFTFVMVVGQLTFKRVAQSLDGISGIGAILRHLVLNPWFLAALMLYGGATLLWVMVLRETPLSKAYMFVALAFALVPLGASVLFHESLGQRYPKTPPGMYQTSIPPALPAKSGAEPSAV
jgi:drug/metabolite transporter (DMT)-like permease